MCEECAILFDFTLKFYIIVASSMGYFSLEINVLLQYYKPLDGVYITREFFPKIFF